MIKAIVFDCFGVLLGVGFAETYRVAGGDPVQDEDFIKESLYLSSAGIITDSEFYERVAAQLGIAPERLREIAHSTQAANLPLFTYIKETLKPHYKIGMLSNAAKGLAGRRLTAEQRVLFDDILVSGEVGLLKPDPEVFRLAAERLGVDCSEMVFTDDAEDNVEAAAACGCTGILYIDYPTFVADLEKVLK